MSQCKSELVAPFYGVDIAHQCTYAASAPPHKHYCGCSYEWQDDHTITNAPEQATVTPSTRRF